MHQDQKHSINECTLQTILATKRERDYVSRCKNSKREQQPELYWTIMGCRIISLGPRKTSDLDEHKSGIVVKVPSDTDSEEEEMIMTMRP